MDDKAVGRLQIRLSFLHLADDIQHMTNERHSHKLMQTTFGRPASMAEMDARLNGIRRLRI